MKKKKRKRNAEDCGKEDENSINSNQNGPDKEHCKQRVQRKRDVSSHLCCVHGDGKHVNGWSVFVF